MIFIYSSHINGRRYISYLLNFNISTEAEEMLTYVLFAIESYIYTCIDMLNKCDTLLDNEINRVFDHSCSIDI